MKKTKKSLLLSALALVLCASMFVGTTFAWFTDSVTSANNIISSGNLDIELYYQLEGESGWTEVTATTNVFMPNALWEPGHTEVVKLKVVNEGSLALKYTLGVNVASEVGSVNANGDPFLLSEYIKYAVIDGAAAYTRDEAIAAAEAADATALKTAYNSEVTTLLKDEESIVTMVVYMPTTVANEANHAKGAAQPTINLGINLFATQASYEEDSFGSDYDEDAVTFVKDAAEAQAALDNAAAGAIIKLAPGVDYGTLYLRPVAGTAPTKEVDWVGNNYRYETYSLYENLTILGAAGATVDAIKIEGGTYYNTEHSQSATYPIMLSLVELKNVVIDGVTFTGNGGYDPQGHGNVINLSGNNIKVDGLTLKDCVLENAANNARLLYKTEATTTVHTYTYGGETFTFSPTLKNITVTGCTFNGGYMGMELRETENLTITNNVFNVADRNILLPVNTGCTYTGNITITGNVSNNAQERFVRADGTGDAVVVIKDNTLMNYMGADSDYIKVTGGNNVTIEDNELLYGFSVTNDAELAETLNIVKTNASFYNREVVISMAAGTYSGDYVINQYPLWNGNIGAGGSANNYGSGVPADAPKSNLVFVGQDGTTFTGNVTISGFGNAGTGFASATAATTFKNITFDGANSVEANGEDYAVVYAKAAANNITFNGCTFKNATHVLLGTESGATAVGRIDVIDCLFNDGGCLSGYFETLNVTNTTVTAAKNGFINKSKAGNVTVTSGTMNVGKYFLRTSNSGINMTVNGATITMYESEGAADLVKFRGSSESATFTGCTLPASYATAGVDGNSTLTIN